MGHLTNVALGLTHWLVNRVAIERVSWLGSLIGRRLGTGSKRHARAVANLAAAMPDKTADEREAIAQDMWDNFGRTIAETLRIEGIAAEPGRVTLANPELLADCGTQDRGTVFVGLHFGNWEVMAVPLVRHGLAPLCVYKPLDDSAVNDWLLSQRRQLYPGGLFPASRATLLRIARHVRGGGSICISADHRDPGGLSVPFFGRPAPSVALPAILAARYGARVLAVRVDRLENSRFSVVLERIEVAESGDADADMLATTATIQARLEAWIKADPGRWLWFYKRWDESDGLQKPASGQRPWRRRPRAAASAPLAEPADVRIQA